MYRRSLIFFAKLLLRFLRLTGSSGSALPGLVLEKMYPNFLSKVLKPVEKRVILVTGTNGKTTTTKMLVESLRGAGKRVVTNATGSNMTRGLIAALIEDMTYAGTLKPTDWFVFEMDEAYAPIFTQKVAPKLVLGLNVLRDQLDRYGEIDTTARLIGEAAAKADIFVYNALDPLLHALAISKTQATVSFGVSKKLLQNVMNEQTLHSDGLAPSYIKADVNLVDCKQIDGKMRLTVQSRKNVDSQNTLNLPLQGFHNALNATAVVAALSALDGQNIRRYLSALANMEVAFGRGETLHLKDKVVTVALIKNPSGFASNIKTFIQKPDTEAVLFVINDKIADGRDVSWLWDVDLRGKIAPNVHIATSGIRGLDMAGRLEQEGYKNQTTMSGSKGGGEIFSGPAKRIVIVPTYTALFEVREALGVYGKVPRIW